MKAIIYSTSGWKGKPEVVGEVRSRDDFDESVAPLINSLHVDEALAEEDFLNEVFKRVSNPPYVWAELEN